MKIFTVVTMSSLLLAVLSQTNILPLMTPKQVASDIEANKLLHNKSLKAILWNFDKIARDNGGNRAHGQPGFNASIGFVLDRLAAGSGRQLDWYVQAFNHTVHRVRGKIALRGPDGEMVDKVTALRYVAATPLPGGVTGRLVDTPVDDIRGSMCFAEQWEWWSWNQECLDEEEEDDKGLVVLMKRGGCPIVKKLMLAQQYGVVAAVLYNDAEGEPREATLGVASRGLTVPAAVVAREVGERWRGQLRTTALGFTEMVPRATLVIDAVLEDSFGWNVVAETRSGDPDSVVMLGAHLDSVAEGPGINDDGSGSAALLEIAASFQKYTGLRNRLRFAWWGAEELGLVGSSFYTSQLGESERDKIKFYFNYDMIGSQQPMFGVQASSEEHMYGARRLYQYLQWAGKSPQYVKFRSSSDYYSFLRYGIPCSGLFTGAEFIHDACYHQACDDLRNVNWDALVVNARAAGYVAAEMALMNLDGMPGRNGSSSGGGGAVRPRWIGEEEEGGRLPGLDEGRHVGCGDEGRYTY